MVVAALSLVVLLAAWQRSSDACTDSVKGVLFALRDDAPPDLLNAAVDAVEDDCEGSSRLVDTGGVLFQEDERAQAAGILRTAARREPDNFSAWAGLAAVLREDDPAGAASAAERARELNRFYRPPSQARPHGTG